MTLGEGTDLIIRRIKRADKAEDVESAINRAIGLFATSTWFHDLNEIQATLNPQTYVQNLNIAANPFVRFRKVKYLRPTGYRKYVTFRDPSRIWEQGCEALDVFYRAGNSILFKLSNLQTTAEVGYYAYHPPLVNPEDTDWMLDQMWPVIETYTLAEMHDEIGNTDESMRHARKWPVMLQAYKDDLGDGTSYG